MPPAKVPFAFTAKIIRVVPLYAIDLPAAVSRAIGKRGTVPVIGTLAGTPFRTTLVPVKGGRHRFWVNASMRAEAGVGLGDKVAVELRVDDDPPQWPTPPDLADALEDEGVFEAFQGIAPGRRNQYVKWLDRAVHEETRARRIARLVEIALAAHEKRIDRQALGEKQRGKEEKARRR